MENITLETHLALCDALKSFLGDEPNRHVVQEGPSHFVKATTSASVYVSKTLIVGFEQSVAIHAKDNRGDTALFLNIDLDNHDAPAAIVRPIFYEKREGLDQERVVMQRPIVRMLTEGEGIALLNDLNENTAII